MFGVSSGRLLTAAMGLSAGLLIGWSALSFGQEQDAVKATQVRAAEVTSADLAALKTQIAALTKRVEELEKPDLSDLEEDPVPALTKRVEDLERAIKEPAKAPFTVVNAAGAPIFTVTAEGGDAAVYVAGTNGSIKLGTEQGPTLELGSGDNSATLATGAVGPSLVLHSGESNLFAGATEGEMTVSVHQGSNTAALFANDAGASVSADEAGRSATLGTFDSTFGFSADVNGARTAALGDRGDGTYSLRLYKPGATLPVVQAGILSSGDAGVIVGDGTNQFARIEGKGGSGVVRTYNAGQEVVTLGKIDERTGLRAKVGEEEVLSVVNGSEGPTLAALTDGNPFFFVDVDRGNPRLELGYDGQNLWAMKTAVQGDLALYDASGEVVRLGANDGSGALALSRGGKPVITLGATDDKPNPAIRTYSGSEIVFAAGTTPEGTGAITISSHGSPDVGMGSGADGGGEVYVTSKGNTVASMNSTDNPGQGLVVVRNGTGAAVAFLGYGSAGGGNVTVTDPAGNGVFSAGYDGGDGPGSACVEHKGTKCLGVGLTGMEGFH